MRTKRYISLLLGLLMMFTFTACGGDKDKDKENESGMTIAPAQLTEEEQNLADLLALGMESHHIFSFQAKGAKSLHFNVYELADGNWSPLPGGGGGGLVPAGHRRPLPSGH